jgi:hypothetical protein
MSGMSNLVIDIQNDIGAGLLTFQAIASKYEVPTSWVNEVSLEMVRNADEYVVENDYFDDYEVN